MTWPIFSSIKKSSGTRKLYFFAENTGEWSFWSNTSKIKVAFEERSDLSGLKALTPTEKYSAVFIWLS